MSGLEIFIYTHRQRMSSLHADDAGVARGESHCACVQNLALSENRWKGAVTALRVREGEGVGQFLLLSYADTQYSEETTDKYCEIQNIIYDVRLARLHN